ncbi:uncharacterized protein SPSC_03100 [Sporisorium scitamineum]|uniref:Uncharacterized protein n=1 Tax=Sporisorium scitamineum TaxID=49012 RepID=A0A0F7S5A9_9BASI|nr:uncharacterized protein SPSC_03100 [Sporisorium scitamineum]CDW98117.1 hypothetical protein [Sporisorium scitamineum]
MPPLPTNGSSYPPSSSGYQPLNLDDDEQADLESSPHASTSSHITQRTFTTSPYRSQANDPTHLLQTFLSDTRPSTAQSKKLTLRITVRYPNTSVAKHVELPLLALTTQDALPFALADDLPCLRGLPGTGAPTWRGKLRRLAEDLTGGSSTSSISTNLHLNGIEDAALQVWNASQSRPLYASEEEIQRHRKRLETSTLPPWTPLNDEFLATPAAQNANDHPNDATDEQVNKLFDASGSLGDFDLSSVFKKLRQRKTSRLVSSGLQEAIERFADDRHFSKHLIARQCVWGWNMSTLTKRVGEMAAEATVVGKGKSREQDDVQVEVQLVGLESLVYHVVWAPIPYLSYRCGVLFHSRTALLCLVGLSALLVVLILLGMLDNTLVIFVAFLVVVSWATLTWLVRTQDACVYDNIGTAWNLAPRWVKIADADAEWDHDAVVESLGGKGEEVKMEKRGLEGWFVQKGMDQDDWLQLHRERLIHLLKP